MPKSSSQQPKSTYGNNEDTYKSTKDDKRRIKHSTLISRIEKANHKTPKRRRPLKKLVATLESLADALPDISEGGKDEKVVDQGRIRHKSLKSRPGAMKKKDQLEKLERERFCKNMAQMAEVSMTITSAPNHAVTVDATTSGDSSKRWAALRGFIQQTMDRDPIEQMA